MRRITALVNNRKYEEFEVVLNVPNDFERVEEERNVLVAYKDITGEEARDVYITDRGFDGPDIKAHGELDSRNISVGLPLRRDVKERLRACSETGLVLDMLPLIPV